MNRDSQIVKTSIIGILGNILLVAGKAIIGFIASSISIILDAVNNLTDALSSVITIIGTKLSSKKPDKKHPFGHGRIEYITSSIIGMIIFAAGAIAIYESIVSLVNQEKATYDIYSFIIISLAIVVKILLGLFFRYRGKKLNSDALKASGLDALLDVVLSVGTLIGAIISYTTGLSLEGYIGIAIGLFIIKSSIDVLRESVSKIIGERSDSETIKQINETIMSFKEVSGVYDLIINNYGADRNIGSVHIEVDDNMTAKEIQLLEREIAGVCYEKYATIMTVGVYARHEDTPEIKEIKNNVLNVITSYPEVLQTHGFYCDLTKKVISADIIIGFGCKNENEIYDEIKEKIKDLYPDFDVYIVLDRDFTLSQIEEK